MKRFLIVMLSFVMLFNGIGTESIRVYAETVDSTDGQDVTEVIPDEEYLDDEEEVTDSETVAGTDEGTETEITEGEPDEQTGEAETQPDEPEETTESEMTEDTSDFVAEEEEPAQTEEGTATEESEEETIIEESEEETTLFADDETPAEDPQNNRETTVYYAQIGDTKYETLQAAFDAASDGDTVTLLGDVDATGTMYGDNKHNLWVGKSLTIDGANGTLTVKNRGIGIQGGNSNIDVTFKNITIRNVGNENGRVIDTRGNIGSLTLDHVTLTTVESSYTGYLQPLTIGGNQSDPATITITDSTITAAEAANKGYAITTFNPVNLTITNSTIKGWANLNLKGADSSAGSAGSVVTISDSNLISVNNYSGVSNAFSLVKIEDNNVTVNITGSTIDVNGAANTQSIVGFENAENSKIELGEGNNVTLSGEADFVTNVRNNTFVITGGTFNTKPEEDLLAEDYVVEKINGVYTVHVGEYVAQVGTEKFTTLEYAVATAQDGETVTLLADTHGNGIQVPQGKYTSGLTIDFAGHTYTMDGNMVGSTGTENQAFQLLKDNNITFKNGTITSAKALFLVQNYSNLTLKGMTLTLNNPNYAYGYTLSNNNGNTVIEDTTINANPAGLFAFDVCRYDVYPSVSVEVKGDSHINGNVEISASNGDAGEGFGLTLTSGTITGELVMDESAAAAMASTPEKVNITKASTFEQEAPAGYKWDENGRLVEFFVAQIGEQKYKTLEAAVAAAQDGATVTLLENTSGNGIQVPQGKYSNGLTIDFDGHTYTMDGKMVGSTGTETQAFQLLMGNKVTFENGTITSSKALMLVQNYSDLTLEGMTLTLNNPDYTGLYTLSNNNGNIAVNNSTINANDPGSVAFDVCRYSSYPSVSVEVKGNSVINGNVELSASNNDAMNGMALTLTSGTINGNLVMDPTASTAMASTPEKVNITKASTFDQEAPEGYKWNAEGRLVAKEYKVQIGDVKYETLEEAVAAANDGETVTLLADCAGNGIVVPQGKYTTGLTIDFNEHTYTVDGNTVGSTGTETQAFQLLMDNKITFKNGTITSAKALMLVQNYSDLTLEGMTLSLTNDNYHSAYTLSNNNGNIVINNTTINKNTGGGVAFDVCRYATYPSVSVEVKGNSVINGNIELSASNNDAMNGMALTLTSGTVNGELVVEGGASAAMDATPDKVNVIKASTFELAVPEDYKWNDAGKLVKKDYVAQIGSKKYETLEEAVTAANDGETVTLLTDSHGNGIVIPEGKYSTGLTVDFGGHTYTMDGSMVGSTGTQTQAFQLLKDNKITFKNGTITSTKALMLVQNYSDLTLKGMTLTLNNPNYANAYTLSNNNGNIVIDDTTINANEAGRFAFDVCRYSSYPSVSVELKGNSVINGDIELSASGNDAMNGIALTLTSGTINGDLVVDSSVASAMDATPDKVNVIKAGTFEQEAPEDYKWNDAGKLVKKEYVAQIGDAKYESLEEAVAAAKDGDTVTLLEDTSGNGIIVPQGKYPNGLTINFYGHTYTVDGNTVGSAGTETQAFQLLKDNKVTFKNGTITSSKALMLIQNYSDLTLDNVILDGTKLTDTNGYVLSTNNGNTVIKDTTINTKDGYIAFDACSGWGGYASNSVEVTGTSVINGDVEVSYYGENGTSAANLTLTSGTLNGAIVMGRGAGEATVRLSKSMKCCCTMPIPRAMASEGVWNRTFSPLT